jgi:hypothetical protein
MNKVSHQRYNINQTECMIWPFLSLHGRRSFPGLPDFRDRLPCRLAISGSSDFDIFPGIIQPDPPNHRLIVVEDLRNIFPGHARALVQIPKHFQNSGM